MYFESKSQVSSCNKNLIIKDLKSGKKNNFEVLKTILRAFFGSVMKINLYFHEIPIFVIREIDQPIDEIPFKKRKELQLY